MLFKPLFDTTLYAPTCNPHLDSIQPPAGLEPPLPHPWPPLAGPQETTKLAAVKAAERKGEELQQYLQAPRQLQAAAAAALPALQGAAHPPGACALRARVAQPAAVPSVGPRSKARGLGFVFV